MNKHENEPVGNKLEQVKLENRVVGLKTRIIPEQFSSLRQLLSKMVGIAEDSTLFRVINNYRDLEQLLKNEGLSLPDFEIEMKDGFFVLYHDTADVTALREALNENDLLNPPPDRKWSARCFGPGLACYTNPSTKCPEGKTRVEIMVPANEVIMIEKKSLWSAYVDKIYSEIHENNEFTQFFSQVCSLFATEFRDDILLKFKSTQAFNYSSYLIDALCSLNKGFTRLNVRQAVQNGFKLSDNKQTSFGYRTYTDEAFLNASVMMEALKHAFSKLNTDEEVEFQEQLLKNLAEKLLDSPLILEDEISRWYGSIDQESETLKKYLILELVLRAELRDQVKEKLNNSDEQFWNLFDGYYPVGEMTMPEGNLFFGTDLGSNNIAVLRFFDQETMSFRILEPTLP